MHPHRIAIRLTIPVTVDLTHQLRNFAEDLHRAFRDDRAATVENMDTATDTVWVRVHSTGKLRPTLTMLHSCLNRALLSDRCKVLTDPRP